MEFVTQLYHGRGPQTQIMFGIGGETDLSERTLDHLSGYGGSRPVRVGNGAYRQRQNDVFGALLDSIYIHSKTRGGVPEEMAPIVFEQAEAASSAWHLPDQGIWESRGEPKHYVSSKLMSWVALDRASRLARSYGRRELAEKWAREAETVKADILDRGVSRPRHVSPALRDRRARCVAPPHPADPLPALRGRAAPGDGPRDRGRAHRARAGAPLQGRRDRATGSAARRGRSRSAPSGSSPPSRRSESGSGRASCASGWSRTGPRWASMRRKLSRPVGLSSGISPRRSAILR